MIVLPKFCRATQREPPSLQKIAFSTAFAHSGNHWLLDRGENANTASWLDSLPATNKCRFANERCLEIACHQYIPGDDWKNGQFPAATSRHAGSPNRPGATGLFLRLD